MITTIGIANKPVSQTTLRANCIKCTGSGLILTGKVEASRIKGLKVSGMVDIHEECDCESGTIPVVVKRIKKADRVKQPIIIQP
jgi:hypothetical protein